MILYRSVLYALLLVLLSCAQGASAGISNALKKSYSRAAACLPIRTIWSGFLWGAKASESSCARQTTNHIWPFKSYGNTPLSRSFGKRYDCGVATFPLPYYRTALLQYDSDSKRFGVRDVIILDGTKPIPVSALRLWGQYKSSPLVELQDDGATVADNNRLKDMLQNGLPTTWVSCPYVYFGKPTFHGRHDIYFHQNQVLNLVEAQEAIPAEDQQEYNAQILVQGATPIDFAHRLVEAAVVQAGAMGEYVRRIKRSDYAHRAACMATSVFSVTKQMGIVATDRAYSQLPACRILAAYPLSPP